MDKKHCKKCNQTLHLKCFGKHNLHKDGLQSSCKECKRRCDRGYAKINKIKKSLYDKARSANETQEDKDQQNARRRELHEANPSIRKKHNREWKKRNPDKVLIQIQKRRARISNANGTFVVGDWECIKIMFMNRCAYCGCKKKLTIDHIVPLSKNGDHDISNIVPACINCNSQKHVNIDGWPIFTNDSYIIEFYK